MAPKSSTSSDVDNNVDGKPASSPVVSPSSPADKPSPADKQSPTPYNAAKSETDAPSKDAEVKSQEVKPSTEQCPIDMNIFGQILELDEDETHDFSQDMVWAYFKQAKDTFVEMEKSLKQKDLKALKDQGHFLKGSSAVLGIFRVGTLCKRIEFFGKNIDVQSSEAKNPNADPSKTVSDEVALDSIAKLIVKAKAEHEEAEAFLRKWYIAEGVLTEPDP